MCKAPDPRTAKRVTLEPKDRGMPMIWPGISLAKELATKAAPKRSAVVFED